MKIASVFTFITLLGVAWFNIAPNLGAQITKNEMKKLTTSPNYTKGKFVNQEETPVMNPESSTFKIMREFMRKGENRDPDSVIRTREFISEQFLSQPKGISFTWFGHSTVLLHVDGKIVLIDPVFAERASPVSFAGTKKFNYSHDYSVADLPHIDWVLLSHDHYDHLDYKTIQQLQNKADKFIVPLGVSQHLLRWEVPTEKIVELDWWETFTSDTSISITATPARHFSGRGLKRNTTLWCSFVLKVGAHTLYFSGDSGYGKHFKEIGNKLGPFDIAFMECGQYNAGWPYIHMNPKETYRAYKDLNAKKMMPIHWGKFKLSLHAWTEPVDILLDTGNGEAQNILIPEIGEIIRLDTSYINTNWWQ